ncbi:MAG: heme transport system substrate-binding protein [Blastocatellia bacterium]|jgi:iron complex transport system substrate-binding protein|nr:heme transport system substrate-binding protein [Blastocatellia bacterium]
MKFKFVFTLLLSLFCALWLCGCRPSSSSNKAGVSVADASGQLVTVSDSSRIVSVGTAITETIYALGAGSRLVGVDNSSSEYLQQAAGLPKVGPRTALNAEGILSLKPTLIIITMDAGPPQVIDQLKNSGVTTLTMNANYTVQSVKAKIETIARALGLEAKGQELSNSIDNDMKHVKSLMDRALATPKVLFVGRGPNMPNATMSGRGTTIDEMIRVAGGKNPMSDFEGFKEMTDEAVVNAAPDIILMTEKSFERSGGVDGVLKFPGVALTPAGRNRRIVAVSDMYFQGFGPGVGRAVYDLTLKLHPEVNAENKGTTSAADAGGDKR